MSFVIGINFRSTSTFVTDSTNETYCLAADSYPTTRGGVTFGISAGFATGAADRDSALDRRLAGIVYKSNAAGTQFTVRVDLPATGQYDLALALGDGGSSQAYQYAQTLDNTTALVTVDDTDGTASAHFDDIAGTDFTAAAWPGSHGVSRKTFSSTILNLVVGSPSAQSGFSTIAHLYISQAPVGPTLNSSPPPQMLG